MQRSCMEEMLYLLAYITISIKSTLNALQEITELILSNFVKHGIYASAEKEKL